MSDQKIVLNDLNRVLCDLSQTMIRLGLCKPTNQKAVNIKKGKANGRKQFHISK